MKLQNFNCKKLDADGFELNSSDFEGKLPTFWTAPAFEMPNFGN